MKSISAMVIASLLCFLLFSLIASENVFADEWKTSKGTPIPHVRLNKSTDPDTAEIYDGKNKEPRQKVQHADPDKNKLNQDDFDPAKRTEDFTEEERQKIHEETQKRHPNIKKEDDPTKSHNCHGFTFGCTKVWIEGSWAAIILKDDYEKIDPGKAQKGDVIVYKKNGKITHSGIISAIDMTKTDKGRVTEVESKWGQGGRYKHKPDDNDGYGDWEVYRGNPPPKPTYAYSTEPVPPGETITWGPCIDSIYAMIVSSTDVFIMFPPVGGSSISINSPYRSIPEESLSLSVTAALTAIAICVTRKCKQTKARKGNQ